MYIKIYLFIYNNVIQCWRVFFIGFNRGQLRAPLEPLGKILFEQFQADPQSGSHDAEGQQPLGRSWV